MRVGTLENSVFVDYTNEMAIVCVAHIRKDGHREETVVDPRTKEESKRCKDYVTIPCAAHDAMYSDTRGTFDFRGTPASFICKPTGEIAVKNDDCPRHAGGIVEKLKEVQQKLGRPVPYSTYRKFEARLEEAKEHIEASEYAKAKGLYDKNLKEKFLTDPMKARVNEALEELNQIGLLLIDEALAEDDPALREKLLKKVKKEFKGLEAEKKAAEALSGS